MDVVTSEKGKNIFIVDGFKFRFHKILQDGIQRWACSQKTCKCFLKVAADNSIRESFRQHNHEKPDDKILNRNALSNALKRKAVKDISSTPSKLIRTELKEADISTISIDDVTLIKRSIRRARASVHPNLPRNIAETQEALKKMDIRSNTGESFMIVNDCEHSTVIFSTATNLKTLCSTSSIYVDGTFKSCPKFFSQLFTIHGFVNGKYIPLVFCLLPSKETAHYEHVFRHVVRCCATEGSAFYPKEMFVDFEIAIHIAAQSIWPAVVIRGCRFHLGQSWWKKLQKLGLTSEYRCNSEESKFLKYFFGLPFLHPEDVDGSFVEDIMAVQPADEKIQVFTDYIFENYISPDAVFPPKVRAQFSASTNRTTNSCESFHSRLNAMFYAPHPHIYNFLDVLTAVQCDTYVLTRSREAPRSYKKTSGERMFLKGTDGEIF